MIYHASLLRAIIYLLEAGWPLATRTQPFLRTLLSQSGVTPLRLAMSNDHAEVASLLLNAGASKPHAHKDKVRRSASIACLSLNTSHRYRYISIVRLDLYLESFPSIRHTVGQCQESNQVTKIKSTPWCSS